MAHVLTHQGHARTLTVTAGARPTTTVAPARPLTAAARTRTLTVEAPAVSLLETDPELVEQGSNEDIVWGIDVAKQLSGVQTITAVVTTLTTSGTPVVLADVPSVNGTRINQRIRAGLTPGKVYRLTVRFTPSGTTNILESRLKIRCPSA